MNLDELDSQWRATNQIAATKQQREQLIAATCRRVERFWGRIFRRDLVETIAAVVVMIVFGRYCYVAPTDHVVSRFGAGFLVCWALFIIYKMHRTRTIQRPAPVDAPVREFCRIELDRLDRQIQLLRSVLGWYIAPCTIGVNIMFIGMAGLGTASLIYGIVTLLLAWGIYALNMRAVAKELVPRRNELASLLGELGDAVALIEQPPERSSKPRRFVSAMVLLTALVALGIAAVALVSQAAVEYPKRAPFSGVRWEGDQPVVRIGEEWFRLVSLDGIGAEDIVAFSWRTYVDKWRKRFEEDLVEVLTRMGHPPQDTVTLVVQSLTSSQTRTLEDVPMTEANRRAIYNAATAHERAEQRQETRSAVPGDGAEERLTELIPRLRKEKQLVGLAAMVMVDGQVVASAADGERTIGSGVRLEIGDRWHVGSVTKSITATMIARLVERGQMQWTDTLGECFPDASIHEDWKPVTLQQLLTHTSGAPANFSLQVRLKQPGLGAECTRERRKAVLDVIAEKPAHPPGKKYAYSNVGYTIAGAMAENAAGVSWEDLVKREVFEPLELTGAGFGPPKSPSKTLDQPRGHRPVLGRKVGVNDDADNTPIMGPAGTVHLTLSDLSKYATEHLRGELGAGKLLAAETYKRLHTPELDDYACGWVVKQPTYEIPHTLYWHNGSNTMWYALVVFIPGKNMTVAVTSNDGDMEQAEAAAWEVVEASAKQFNVEGDAARRKSLPSEAFPKKSPFAAVRWRDSQPEVRVNKEWFQLVSLDGIAAGDIVAFSQSAYEDQWRKRFEEDLVEVLFRMGHEPKDTARLVVRPLGSSRTRTLEDVAMTEANRQAIRAAAADR
jgi:CubicO group peptidase (beta-lactamase class C family)